MYVVLLHTVPTLRLRADELEELDSRRLWRSTPAVTAEQALDMLKEHRQKSFRHTWDVNVKPQFLEDFGRLEDHMKEAVIAAVALLANSKYPATGGYPTAQHYLDGYEIGHGYRIIFLWHTSSHSITLCFVRTNDDVDEGEGRLRLPDPTDNPDSWMQDTIEENLDESYGILRDDDAGSSEEE